MWLSPLFGVVAIFTSQCNGDAFASIAPQSYFTTVRTPQMLDDPIITDAANFAVAQLRTLSDSGIYTTLSLAKIHAAATELADFHCVIHLQVALTSPYFRSKRKEEDFELMVLESKSRVEGRASGRSDIPRSIAIDKFPEMDENAVESYWVKLVEEKRQRRRKLFELWNSEEELKEGTALQTVVYPPVKKATKVLTLDELHKMPTQQLQQLLTTPESTSSLCAAISGILNDRLKLLEQNEKHRNDQQQMLSVHQEL